MRSTPSTFRGTRALGTVPWGFPQTEAPWASASGGFGLGGRSTPFDRSTGSCSFGDSTGGLKTCGRWRRRLASCSRCSRRAGKSPWPSSRDCSPA